MSLALETPDKDFDADMQYSPPLLLKKCMISFWQVLQMICLWN